MRYCLKREIGNSLVVSKEEFRLWIAAGVCSIQQQFPPYLDETSIPYGREQRTMI